MSLFESGENYLEEILILTKRNGSVRSIDIANDMEFTKLQGIDINPKRSKLFDENIDALCHDKRKKT